MMIISPYPCPIPHTLTWFMYDTNKGIAEVQVGTGSDTATKDICSWQEYVEIVERLNWVDDLVESISSGDSGVGWNKKQRLAASSRLQFACSLWDSGPAFALALGSHRLRVQAWGGALGPWGLGFRQILERFCLKFFLFWTCVQWPSGHFCDSRPWRGRAETTFCASKTTTCHYPKLLAAHFHQGL